jgi:hypothetical protein
MDIEIAYIVMEYLQALPPSLATSISLPQL